jgi:hypothetical protein
VGHLLKRVAFSTDEVMVEDAGSRLIGQQLRAEPTNVLSDGFLISASGGQCRADATDG